MSGASYFGKDTPDIVLQSLFSKYDKDGSGILGKNELRTFMQDDLGLDTEQSEIYTLLNDGDGSNTWSFGEFKIWLNSCENFQIINNSSKYYLMSQAVEMFAKYDHDKTGSLDIKELAEVLTDIGCGDGDVELARQALDTDGNKLISFPEFLAWLNWF